MEMWRDSDEAREGGPDLCGVEVVLVAAASGARVAGPGAGAVKVPNSWVAAI